MLIHNHQLSEMARQRLTGRIAEILRATYTDAGPLISSDAGRTVLRDQYEKANHYGFSAELDIARYVITAWLLGINFDTQFPAMREILNNPNLLPDEKSAAVERLSIALLATLKGNLRS